MVLSPDRERLKTLLIETITLLCKNGLDFQNEFSVDALIGITLDQNDVFLVTIKETIKPAVGSEHDVEQGEACNELSVESFADAQHPSGFQTVEYQKTPVSKQPPSHHNNPDDVIMIGNELNVGKSHPVPGSRRKTKTNNTGRVHSAGFSPSRNENCLPAVAVGSPSARDEISDLENVFPTAVSQKTFDASEGFLFANHEPPRKRRCGVSPTSKTQDDGIGTQEKAIEDIITQCKAEPIDIIKLEESPIEDEIETPDKQDSSNFMYGAAYNELNSRLETTYANWYCQDDLLSSGAVAGCSSWTNSSISSKHKQDQAPSWSKGLKEVQALFNPVDWQKDGGGEMVDQSREMPLVPWSTTLQAKKFPFKCTLCDKQVKLLRDLRAHMATKHNREKDFACQMCGSQFTYKHNLLCHLRTVHGLK